MIAMSNNNVLTLDDVPERDFFQGDFQDDFDCNYDYSMNKGNTPLNDVQIKMLITIYKYNLNQNIIGRKILLESFRDNYNLSEYAIRKNLSYLENLGYISLSRGKVGIILTELGKNYIKLSK